MDKTFYWILLHCPLFASLDLPQAPHTSPKALCCLGLQAHNTAACALHMIAHLCTRLHIIGQKNSGAHQLANLQAISSPLCRLDQHCHPLRLLPLTLCSLEISSSILHQFELFDCSKREFPKSTNLVPEHFPLHVFVQTEWQKERCRIQLEVSVWKFPFWKFEAVTTERITDVEWYSESLDTMQLH